MRHIWIIKRDSSTMLFYHSFDNRPFKAMIVSGLLAALHNFSKVEIQEEGIQSVEMHDLRWTYLSSDEYNLLLIAADTKDRNSKMMKAQLMVICKMFVKKFHLDLEYWEDSAYRLGIFDDFKQTLNDLKSEWLLASDTADLSNIFDLLGVFQQILQKFINYINLEIKTPRLDRILGELLHLSPQLKEWYNKRYNPEAFKILQLYIPQIDLKKKQIYFNRTTGESLIKEKSIGLEPEYIKNFFFLLIKFYSESISNAIPDYVWYKLISTEILPYFLQQWKYLDQLGILHELMQLICAPLE